MVDPVDIAHNEYHNSLVDFEEKTEEQAIFDIFTHALNNPKLGSGEHVIDNLSGVLQSELIEHVCADVPESKDDLTVGNVSDIIESYYTLRNELIKALKTDLDLSEE